MIRRKLTNEERLERQRKRSLEYRRKRKAAKACMGCGEQDEDTLAGRSYCAACAKYWRDKKRVQYWVRKENHICADCGRIDERTLGGGAHCAECTKKIAAAALARYHRRKEEKKNEEVLYSAEKREG